MNGFKANARIRAEQDVDLAVKNMKLKILGQPYDEGLIMTDSRYKITKQMKTVSFLKMAYWSENILEKEVVSNIAKFSSQSN